MLFPSSPSSEVSFVDSSFWGEGEVNLIGIDRECIILIMIFFFMFQIFREIEKKKFEIYW